MAVGNGPKIITDGLVLALDAGDRNSYVSGSTTWIDNSGNGKNYTLGSNLSYSNNSFTLSNAGGAGGGALNTSAITTSTTCTMVFFIKTTSPISLFWGADPDATDGGGFYVGAYRVGNKEYYGNCGTPDYYQDLVDTPNIYDYLLDNRWHMVEFKNVNFSTWTNEHNFNSYSSFTFSNGECPTILMYNRNLTAAESQQNYNAFKTRFGLI